MPSQTPNYKQCWSELYKSGAQSTAPPPLEKWGGGTTVPLPLCSYPPEAKGVTQQIESVGLSVWINDLHVLVTPVGSLHNGRCPTGVTIYIIFVSGKETLHNYVE